MTAWSQIQFKVALMAASFKVRKAQFTATDIICLLRLKFTHHYNISMCKIEDLFRVNVICPSIT